MDEDIKVDVAVQSYKKPELLLYMLMSLKKHSEKHIDTIFINDDSDVPLSELEKIYLNPQVTQYFAPWKIVLRQNSKTSGYWPRFVLGYWPKGISLPRMIYVLGKSFIRHKKIFISRKNVRYQSAFDNSKKKYLFVVHDDIVFNNDVLGLYLDSIGDKDVAGDLGQCWRCCYQENCNPQKILAGEYPSKNFPDGIYNKEKGLNHLACRINEWSCLVKIQTELEIAKKYHVFFGNFEDDGDVASYWFRTLVRNGYSFTDPLPTADLRWSNYVHGWIGHSGHSVWEDQGNGKKLYNPEFIKERMLQDFGVCLI